MLLFPKQFTVGVLNPTLDVAALGLVGVAAFLGFEVVLAPGMAFDSALLLATLFLQFDCMKKYFINRLIYIMIEPTNYYRQVDDL